MRPQPHSRARVAAPVQPLISIRDLPVYAMMDPPWYVSNATLEIICWTRPYHVPLEMEHVTPLQVYNREEEEERSFEQGSRTRGLLGVENITLLCMLKDDKHARPFGQARKRRGSTCGH